MKDKLQKVLGDSEQIEGGKAIAAKDESCFHALGLNLKSVHTQDKSEDLQTFEVEEVKEEEERLGGKPAEKGNW